MSEEEIHYTLLYLNKETKELRKNIFIDIKDMFMWVIQHLKLTEVPKAIDSDNLIWFIEY